MQPPKIVRIPIKNALARTLACLYFPFIWILFIDYPWGAHRLHSLLMWPILPGFLASALPEGYFFGRHNPYNFLTTAGFIAIVLVTTLTWLGTRGPRWASAAILIGLLISIPSSLAAYAAFRM